jgi:hypothetical protein
MNIPSGAVRKRILNKRNAIWDEVLERLNGIVNRLNRTKNQQPITVNFRMADWAGFLFRALRKKKHDYIRDLLEKINNDQILFLEESNPLLLMMQEWLKDPVNLNSWIESGEIRDGLRPIAQQKGLAFKEYENDQHFGAELRNVTSTLSKICHVDFKRPRGRNVYRFSQKKKP